MKEKIKNNDSLFSEEARLESDDEATTAQGGGIGWVAKGATVPQFDSVVFGIEPNAVSMPVKTRNGYELIFVEQREMRDGKLQARVRHILRKDRGHRRNHRPAQRACGQRTFGDRHRRRQGACGQGFEGPCRFDRVFSSAATLFRRVGYVAGAASFAFRHEENEVSDMLENDDGYYIFQIKGKAQKRASSR